MLLINDIVKIDNVGNPYIYMDYIKDYDDIKYANISKQLSNKIYGLSSDGIITIDTISSKKFKMRIYNSDGSLAKMCGNGLRGATYYILYKKKYQLDQLNKVDNESNYNIDRIFINTDSGLKTIYILFKKLNEKDIDGEKLSKYQIISYLNDLNMLRVFTHVGNPKIYKNINKLNISYKNTNFNLFAVDNGNLHFIYFFNNNLDIKTFDNFNIEDLFVFTHENFFPEKGKDKKEIVNVSILMNYKNKYFLRTRERGANETLSCGTASASTSFILNMLGYRAFENENDNILKNNLLSFLNIKNRKNFNFYSIYHKGGIIKNLVIDNKVYQTGESKILLAGDYFYEK